MPRMPGNGSNETVTLTSRFTDAVDYARKLHTGLRKGNRVPYMAHLLGVASLVLGESGHVPFPVTEDVAIAAILHDTVEDEGGMPRLHDIEKHFGHEVAEIVEGCSDSFEEDSRKKQEWTKRKNFYISRLWEEPETVLLVSAADKVYNARSILEDYRIIGPEVWKRFQRGRNDQIWYYEELLKVFRKRCPDWRIVEELRRVVSELERLSAQE